MQTDLTEVSKLLTKSPKCPATTGNNMATKQTSPDLWMFFEPLLLDPFLACCHSSQCQLPESRSSAGLCLPAKPEPALGSHQEPTPPAACRFSFMQLWWTARFLCFAHRHRRCFCQCSAPCPGPGLAPRTELQLQLPFLLRSAAMAPNSVMLGVLSALVLLSYTHKGCLKLTQAATTKQRRAQAVSQTLFTTKIRQQIVTARHCKKSLPVSQ